MNSTLGASPSTSRMGSLASIGQPMAVERTDPSGTVYIDKGETATVEVRTMPPRTFTDAQNTAAGVVRYQESRHALTPTVAGPQTVNSNVWMEDGQPTYSTRSYETIRRDPQSLFPGANIVAVGTPGVVQTPLGSVYNPRENTFYSRLTNQTAYVEPLGAAAGSSSFNYMPMSPPELTIAQTGSGYTTGTTYNPITMPPAVNPTYLPQVPGFKKPSSGSFGSKFTSGSLQGIAQNSWMRP